MLTTGLLRVAHDPDGSALLPRRHLHHREQIVPFPMYAIPPSREIGDLPFRATRRFKFGIPGA